MTHIGFVPDFVKGGETPFYDPPRPRTLTLDGKPDRTRYPLELAPNEEIESVSYKDMTLPRQYRRDNFYVPPNATLIHVDDDATDMTPDSEIAAYWFLRACSEHLRKPCFFYYRPTQKLIAFPPVPSGGDQIIVRIQPALESKPDES